MSNKKNQLVILVASLVLMLLVGCGEQICSYCGQSKQCGEYDILGTKRYICEDCLGSTAMSLSGNVIGEYESPLVDPLLYLPTTPVYDEVEQPDSSVSGNYSDMGVLDDYKGDSASSNQASDSNPTSSVGAAGRDKDSMVTASATVLSGSNYFLTPDTDNKDKYYIYNGGDVTGLSVTFSKGNNGNGKALVAMKQGASDQDFANVCICLNQAFLISNDYTNDGVDVFNNARDHGNYRKNDCKFYYMDGLDSSTNNGAIATYEINID